MTTSKSKNRTLHKPPMSKSRIALIFDTNVMYSDKPHIYLHTELLRLIKSVRNASELDLFVPKIFIEERIQQCIDGALTQKKIAAAALRDFRLLYPEGPDYKMPEDQTLSVYVTSEFEKLVSDLSIVILELDKAKFDLDEAVDMAIRKTGVFETKRSVKGQSGEEIILEVREKGFKDFVGFSTLKSASEKFKPYDKVYFVCADGKLRDLVLKQIGGIECCTSTSAAQEEIAKYIENLTETDVAILRERSLPEFSREILPKITEDISRIVLQHSKAKDLEAFLSMQSPRKSGDYETSIVPGKTSYLGNENGRCSWRTVLEVKREFIEVSAWMLLAAERDGKNYAPTRRQDYHKTFECDWTVELSDDHTAANAKLIELREMSSLSFLENVLAEIRVSNSAN